MKNPQNTGQTALGWQPSRPRRYQDRRQGGGSGQRASTRTVWDGDGGHSELTDRMAAMFDRLRDAAAKHDRDDDPLRFVQEAAACGHREERLL